MKTLFICLVSVLAQTAFADGKCVSLPDKGAHEGFCNNLNRQTCGVHSALCKWANPKVIETLEPSCVAKEGKQAHSSFCQSQNKMTCTVHSMCKWE
jgi:hypothetical protein